MASKDTKALTTKHEHVSAHYAKSKATSDVCVAYQNTGQRMAAQSVVQSVDSSLQPGSIHSINMGLYSSEEIKAVCIQVTDTLPSTGKDEHAMSIGRDVNSCIFGTWEQNYACTTCARDYINCPGHYGYIDLRGKYYNPMFLNHIRFILACVCQSCGGLLLSEEFMRDNGILSLSGLDRLKMIAEYTGYVKCKKNTSACQVKSEHGKRVVGKFADGQNRELTKSESVQSIIQMSGAKPRAVDIEKCTLNMCTKVEGDTIKYVKGKGETKTVIDVTPEAAYAILSNIPDKDVELLGFDIKVTHPKNMIMSELVVIPPICRPPSIFGGNIQDNKLTLYYDAILRSIKDIEMGSNAVDAKSKIVEHINKIMMGSKQQEYFRGRPTKPQPGLLDMLSKKKGAFRANMQGKKSHIVARSVLAPAVDMDVGYLGIPFAWSDVLTIPEKVTVYNIHKMVDMIRNGKILFMSHEGVKFESIPYTITQDMYEELVPSIGDILYRRIEDGDYILFNRQPTLSKQSTMTMKLILNKESQTFRLPLPLTAAYNADFDGDEGNATIPQSEGSRVEAQEIMSVVTNIIGSESNSPSIGVLYNGITGTYLMTMNNALSREGFAYCTKAVMREDIRNIGDRFRRNNVDGSFNSRKLFSYLLPPTIKYDKGEIHVKDGILLQGDRPITKSNIGRSTGSIIHSIYIQYGKDRAAEFISKCTAIADRFLDIFGFSVGITDCILYNENVKLEIEKRVESVKRDVKALGDLDKMDPIDRDRTEEKIVLLTRGVAGVGSKLFKSLDKYHPFRVMVDSGAKGGVDNNIVPVMGIIGGQLLRGKRLPRTMNRGRRSTAHFPVGDDSIESRGFISSNYYKGVNPVESFFLMTAGREGLADTAVRTALSGYTQRMTVKTVESTVPENNGLVMTFGKQICSTEYGCDGFDPRRIFPVTAGDRTVLFPVDIKSTVGNLNSMYGY